MGLGIVDFDLGNFNRAKKELARSMDMNAKDVLAALNQEAPQVMISDIRMPGGSGLELLGKLKERLPQLPVIIMPLIRMKAWSDHEVSSQRTPRAVSCAQGKSASDQAAAPKKEDQNTTASTARPVMAFLVQKS